MPLVKKYVSNIRLGEKFELSGRALELPLVIIAVYKAKSTLYADVNREAGNEELRRRILGLSNGYDSVH